MPFILLTLTKAFVLSFLLSRRWTGGRRVMLWSGNLCSFPLSLSRVWGQVLEGGERIHVSASLLCLLQPQQKGGSSTDQKVGGVSGGAPLCQSRLCLELTKPENSLLFKLGWLGCLSGSISPRPDQSPPPPLGAPLSSSLHYVVRLGDSQKDFSLYLPLLTPHQR